MMKQAKYIIIDPYKLHKDGYTQGAVYFKDDKGKTVDSFEYAFYKDLNLIKEIFNKFNQKAKELADEKKQKSLF